MEKIDRLLEWAGGQPEEGHEAIEGFMELLFNTFFQGENIESTEVMDRLMNEDDPRAKAYRQWLLSMSDEEREAMCEDLRNIAGSDD